jgi:hypothetical protein
MGEPVEVYERLVEQLPKAKRYTDYREMLAQQKDIDAVIVATPDHMHAAIASAAMDLGKHVYVQKPLCWSVEEARHLAAKAKANPKIATQMGNQGHSASESRMTVEYIQQGGHRRRQRSARLDEPSARLLAAGTPAPEADGVRTDAGMERRRRRATPRGRDGGRRPRGAQHAQLGSLPRRRACRRIPPGLSPVQLARLGRLGARARSATWART